MTGVQSRFPSGDRSHRWQPPTNLSFADAAGRAMPLPWVTDTRQQLLSSDSREKLRSRAVCGLPRYPRSRGSAPAAVCFLPRCHLRGNSPCEKPLVPSAVGRASLFSSALSGFSTPGCGSVHWWLFLILQTHHSIGFVSNRSAVLWKSHGNMK